MVQTNKPIVTHTHTHREGHLTLYIRVGHYAKGMRKNVFHSLTLGGKKWIDTREQLMFEGLDPKVYVRALAKAIATKVGEEGVLRRDDSGDRLDPDMCLEKNGIRGGFVLKFDTTKKKQNK